MCRNIVLCDACFPSFYDGRDYHRSMNIIRQLEEQVAFSANEKQLAVYILRHKDSIAGMSIQKLAAETYTSTSTVLRLCRRLNLSGYKELKIRLAQEANHPETDSTVDPNLPFARTDSIGEIAAQMMKLTEQSLAQARGMLSVSDIRRACMILEKGRTRSVFGTGDAYLCGLMFQARMVRAGIQMTAEPVYGEQHHRSMILTPEDAALILSYSGTTSETLTVARELKKRKVPTVGITANADSPLVRLCTAVLFLPPKEQKHHRIGSFFSEASMTYVLNILYACIYVDLYEETKEVD